MVRRLPSGDLSWMQDDVLVTVSKEDAAQYSPAAKTEDAQNSANEANKDSHDAYCAQVAKLQLSVDASKPIPGIPPKPMYVEVSDPHADGTVITEGVKTVVPWPDPLPELKKKTVYPSGKPAQEEDFIFAGQAHAAPPAAAPKK